MNKMRNICIIGIMVFCVLLCVQAPPEAKAVEVLYFNRTTDSVLQYDNTAVKYNYNGVDVDMNGNINAAMRHSLPVIAESLSMFFAVDVPVVDLARSLEAKLFLMSIPAVTKRA